MGWRDRLGKLWRHPAAGEQFGQAQLANQPLREGPRYPGPGTFWGGTYHVTDNSSVNYPKARQLYANTLAEYKLGAGFAKPIINATAGFMGVPSFTHAGDVEPVNEALKAFFESEIGTLYLAQRDSMRDGDCYLRLVYGPDPIDPAGNSRFNLVQLVPDTVTPVPALLGEGWSAVVIEHAYTPPMPQRPFIILETISREQVSYRVEGEATPEIRSEWDDKVEPNRWGLIPIVHFRNEGDPSASRGVSDLEALEPFFRAYHDTLLVGLGGIQWFAKPKAIFNLGDVDTFIDENFRDAQKTGAVPNFQGRDMFLMNLEDKVSFLTANPGTEGVAKLLELLFLNIVDTSETPEFVMGGAIASSKASVSEQMIPFTKKIERKRLQFTMAHRELAAKYLAMASLVGELGGVLDSYAVNLTWPEITPKDESAIAATIKTLVDAFVAAVDAGLISAESASDFLQPLVTTMVKWKGEEGGEPDERDKIEEGLQFLQDVKTAAAPPAPPGGAFGGGFGGGFGGAPGNAPAAPGSAQPTAA